MSADLDLDSWLGTGGFPEGAPRADARQALEAAQLTRPGKTRLSVEKTERATAALRGVFVLHCLTPECVTFATTSGRRAVRSIDKSTCEWCSGSDNLRAARELVEKCRQRGLRRLVVVGGNPATREALERLLADQLELRLVDGTRHRAPDRARADLDWADRVLLWGATELHHKVSKQYSDITATRQKVVHVRRRGISQLLQGASESIQRR